VQDHTIIDIHTHIGHLPGQVGDVYTPQDLNYICMHENVHYMLVSSASASSIGQHYGTKEVIEMVSQYGKKLGGMLWVNPHDSSWIDDVPLAVKHQFYGIKIHPVLDHYAVSNNALDNVFDCARKHHWPILTHTDIDGSSMDAANYEPLISAYPDVPLILAHLRWGAIPLAKRYANVFVDTTYVDPMIVEIGLDALGSDKILFGTDAAEGFEVGRIPGHRRPKRSYQTILQALRARGISDLSLEIICYQNARKLFNIKEA
jgi:predicted TIM-barrel fold metal-dependent hydrolase